MSVALHIQTGQNGLYELRATETEISATIRARMAQEGLYVFYVRMFPKKCCQETSDSVGMVHSS